MNSWLISLIVNNHFGVLTRVTGLFSRRGYNIASLSVGETNSSELSRITIQTSADGAVIRQIIKQLEKLEDVKSVSLLPKAESIARELIIAKVIVPFSKREKLEQELSGFEIKRPYSDEGKIIFEFASDLGTNEKILQILSEYTITELCRTGVTAMTTVDSG